VLEPELTKGLVRAEQLYQAGVRAFRVYSPEPGKEAVQLIASLVKTYGQEIEIFAGQVVALDQALAFEAAGAHGIYIGIGGGGRCITAWRSGVQWTGRDCFGNLEVN